MITNTLLVLSGKGGVGKSTIATELAIYLAGQGFKTGILDVDLCGPSIPKLLRVDSLQVWQTNLGWKPVQVPLAANSGGDLKCMSIAFLLKSKKDAVIWRGPKKTAMIRQFVNDVAWGDLDYLVVDCPPGTSDEHLSIVESITSGLKALIVTTPQVIY